MTRTAFHLAVALLLLLPVAAAAQHHGGPAADPANAFEVTGPVISFTAAAGAGMPTLAVEDAVLGPVDVGLGPVWYLQQAGFSAAPGNAVELLAYPCTTCSLPAVAAWVNNLTTGAGVELRDDEGYPLWRQQGGGHGGHPRCEPASSSNPGTENGHGGHGGGPGSGGQTGNGPGPHGEPGEGPGPQGEPGAGPGPNGEPGEGPGPHGGPGEGPGPYGEPGAGPGPHGGQCDWNAPDMSAVATATGTVVSIAAMPGGGMPAMVLATDGGDLELLLSPYHPIAAAGFLIEPGMELAVTYAPWVIGGEELLATISFTDPVTGLTIQLRDPETGYPVRGGHGYGR